MKRIKLADLIEEVSSWAERIASSKIYPKGVTLPHLKIYPKNKTIASQKQRMGGRNEANVEREAIINKSNSGQV